MEPKAAAQNRASTTVAVVKPPVVSSEREKETSEDVEEPKAAAQNRASTAGAAANPPVVASKEREKEKVEGEGALAPPASTDGALNFNLPNTAVYALGTERKDFFENADRLHISQFGVHFEPDCTYIGPLYTERGYIAGAGFSFARCTIFKTKERLHLDIFSERSDAGGYFFPERTQKAGGFLGFEIFKGVSAGIEGGLLQNYGPQDSTASPFVGIGVRGVIRF